MFPAVPLHFWGTTLFLVSDSLPLKQTQQDLQHTHQQAICTNKACSSNCDLRERRKLCTDIEIEVNSNCCGGDDENQVNGVRASVTLEGDFVSFCLETWRYRNNQTGDYIRQWGWNMYLTEHHCRSWKTSMILQKTAPGFNAKSINKMARYKKIDYPFSKECPLQLGKYIKSAT